MTVEAVMRAVFYGGLATVFVASAIVHLGNRLHR